MIAQALMPAWFAVSAAAVLMLVAIVHLGLTLRSTEPPSRRRIRIANAGVMMLTLPLLAAGFSLIDPNRDPRTWTLVWIAAMALLAINVGLAILDVLNTMRLTFRARRKLHETLVGYDRDARAFDDPRSPPPSEPGR